MAASYHPTRSHPFTSEVDQHLIRLRSSQSATTSSINGLQDLYHSVDRMLQLSLLQQALAKGHEKEVVEDLLNGSLRILDICSISQNALQQTKKSVRELQSVLRGKRGDEIEITNEIKKYLASRKAVKKAVHKALGNFKGMENKCSASNNEEPVIMLKEVETITLAAFESMLLLVSGPRTSSRLMRLSWFRR